MTPSEIQRQYLGDVLRYVSYFVRPQQEAEDVAMEVFHAAFQAFGSLRRKDDPKVWLLGIARRKVADSLRASGRRGEIGLEAAEGLSSAQPAENADLDRLLAEMPEDQAAALVLKYGYGFSTLEVASALQRSEAAANSLLQRARARFEELGKEILEVHI